MLINYTMKYILDISSDTNSLSFIISDENCSEKLHLLLKLEWNMVVIIVSYTDAEFNYCKFESLEDMKF